MNILRKIGAGYYQLRDDFILFRILKNIEPININSSKKLFIFSHRTSSYYLELYVLLAHALAKKGYPSCFLFRDRLIDRYLPNIENLSKTIDLSNFLSFNKLEVGPYFPKLIIDNNEVSNSFIQVVSKIKITRKNQLNPNYKWKIDFERGLAISHEINFFPIIHNTLRIVFKRYNLDFQDKKVISVSNDLIKSCENLIFLFFQLKKFSKQNNINIRLVGWELSYLPNGIFKVLCKSLSENRDIECIDLARGYAKYFGHHHHESYIALSNLTKSGKLHRIMLNKKEVNNLTKDYNKDILFNEMGEIIKKPSKITLRTNQLRIVEEIKKFKSFQNKVFVLFTHLFYDTPLEDSTQSFKGMCEWIDETINYFRKSDNILLLKPHPNEIRPDAIQREPNETLKTYIKKNEIELKNNIILLEPKQFGLNEIVNFIDCGLIWRSSAAMELAINNKPCIICGNPPYKAINFNYVKNKKHYFDMIENVNNLCISENLKLNVAR